MSPAIRVRSVHYPESRRRPICDTDMHRDEVVRQIELLRQFFAQRKVYVSGHCLAVYYDESHPRRFVVPDVFVVKGLRAEKRQAYKFWIERRVPDAILEVTSRENRRTDAVTKPNLYHRLGVKEYFLFDPAEEYMEPPLQGFRLAGDRYEPIATDDDWSLVSDELGLRLRAEEGRLMFYRLDTGERLLTEWEARLAAEAELARLREEPVRRDGT